MVFNRPTIYRSPADVELQTGQGLGLGFADLLFKRSSVTTLCVLTGPAGGAGGGPFGKGEGGRGSQAGSSAGQEGERDPEEGHQEGEAETQDYLQGSFTWKHSNLKYFPRVVETLETCISHSALVNIVFCPHIFPHSAELELLC